MTIVNTIETKKMGVEGLASRNITKTPIQYNGKNLMLQPLALYIWFILQHVLYIKDIFCRNQDNVKAKEISDTIRECYLVNDSSIANQKAQRILEDDTEIPIQDVKNVVAVMLQYLKSMPEPLRTSMLERLFAVSVNNYKSSNAASECVTYTRLHQIQVLTRLLPTTNYTILIDISELCSSIVAHTKYNHSAAKLLGLAIGCSHTQAKIPPIIIKHKDTILYDVSTSKKVVKPILPSGYRFEENTVKANQLQLFKFKDNSNKLLKITEVLLLTKGEVQSDSYSLLPLISVQKVHYVVRALVQYLKANPMPLFTFKSEQMFVQVMMDYMASISSSTSCVSLPDALLLQMQNLLQALSPCHRSSLIELVNIIDALVKQSDMTSEELALNLVGSSTLIRPDMLTFITDHKAVLLYKTPQQIESPVLDTKVSTSTLPNPPESEKIEEEYYVIELQYTDNLNLTESEKIKEVSNVIELQYTADLNPSESRKIEEVSNVIELQYTADLNPPDSRKKTSESEKRTHESERFEDEYNVIELQPTSDLDELEYEQYSPVVLSDLIKSDISGAKPELPSLVGIALMEAAVKSDPRGLVPAPVALCKEFITKHGLKTEGIFRKPGGSRKAQDILVNISSCFFNENSDFSPSFEKARLILEDVNGQPVLGVHDVATALTRYLRALPEPLLTDQLGPLFAKAVITYSEAKTDAGDNPQMADMALYQIQILMKLLPTSNRATLTEVIELFSMITSNADTNLMTSTNLGLCIGHSVAQPETLTFLIDHKDDILYGKLRKIDVSMLEKAMSILSGLPGEAEKHSPITLPQGVKLPQSPPKLHKSPRTPLHRPKNPLSPRAMAKVLEAKALEAFGKASTEGGQARFHRGGDSISSSKSGSPFNPHRTPQKTRNWFKPTRTTLEEMQSEMDDKKLKKEVFEIEKGQTITENVKVREENNARPSVRENLKALFHTSFRLHRNAK